METTFEEILTQCESLTPGRIIDDLRIAELITAAEIADDPHDSLWPRLAMVLEKSGGMKPKDAARETRRARIINDLGEYPYTVERFIELFIGSRNITMDYKQMFFGADGRDIDLNQIENLMVLWTLKHGLYNKNGVVPAFDNWRFDALRKLLIRAYERVAYDHTADAGELRRFAEFLTLTDPTAPDEDRKKLIAGTEIALANFIFRTKNHLRGNWKHSAHLMPILYAPEQGEGKSSAIKHLIRAIGEDFHVEVGFEMLDDNSKSFDFSVFPVMLFDELAGIGKADVEKIKAIMTAESRQLRQAYGKATSRKIMSTFIGCSNRDVSTVIRDETGNRRFLQIATPVISRQALAKYDALAMWRSVDENSEEPPQYQGENAKIIADLQRGQRFLPPVEEWLMHDDGCGSGLDIHKNPIRETASDAFKRFLNWWKDCGPKSYQPYTPATFGRELTRLSNSTIYKDRVVRHPFGSGSKYTITDLPEPAESQQRMSGTQKVVEMMSNRSHKR